MSIRDQAVAAIRYHGSVQGALDSGKCGWMLRDQLDEMFIENPDDMFMVNPGDRLRHPDSVRCRYLMTDDQCVVDLKTGVIQTEYELNYPLEIYRYAR